MSNVYKTFKTLNTILLFIFLLFWLLQTNLLPSYAKFTRWQHYFFKPFKVAGDYSWPVGWVQQATIVARSMHSVWQATDVACTVYNRDIVTIKTNRKSALESSFKKNPYWKSQFVRLAIWLKIWLSNRTADFLITCIYGFLRQHYGSTKQKTQIWLRF